MDIDTLLKALDKDDNEEIIDMTTEKIQEQNHNVLLELKLERDHHMKIMEKLDQYKYIEDIANLKSGSFIRWIRIDNPSNLQITKGALVCDIKFTDTGISVICKGYHHRHFQLDFDKCLVFQRLSEQEMVLLSALNYLAS